MIMVVQMVLDFNLAGSSLKSSIRLVSVEVAPLLEPRTALHLCLLFGFSQEICSRRLHSFSVDISPVAQG